MPPWLARVVIEFRKRANVLPAMRVSAPRHIPQETRGNLVPLWRVCGCK